MVRNNLSVSMENPPFLWHAVPIYNTRWLKHWTCWLKIALFIIGSSFILFVTASHHFPLVFHAQENRICSASLYHDWRKTKQKINIEFPYTWTHCLCVLAHVTWIHPQCIMSRRYQENKVAKVSKFVGKWASQCPNWGKLS